MKSTVLRGNVADPPNVTEKPSKSAGCNGVTPVTPTTTHTRTCMRLLYLIYYRYKCYKSYKSTQTSAVGVTHQILGCYRRYGVGSAHV
jgi:hypothetical protein